MQENSWQGHMFAIKVLCLKIKTEFLLQLEIAMCDPPKLCLLNVCVLFSSSAYKDISQERDYWNSKFYNLYFSTEPVSLPSSIYNNLIET